MTGWYRMHRGWMDNPMFGTEPFDRRSAFVWLIENAAFEDGRIWVSGKRVDLQRGQLCVSIRFMARAWNWDEKKVRRFLDRGKKEEIFAADTAAGQTLITIYNYNKYQSSRDGAAADTAAETPQERRGDAAKYKNERNKEYTSPTINTETARESVSPISTDNANAVLRAAGWEREPSDFGKTLQAWLADGIDVDDSILPAVRKQASEMRNRGSPARTLKVFDESVRLAHDAETSRRAYIDAIPERIRQQDEAQKKEDIANATHQLEVAESWASVPETERNLSDARIAQIRADAEKIFKFYGEPVPATLQPQGATH